MAVHVLIVLSFNYVRLLQNNVIFLILIGLILPQFVLWLRKLKMLISDFHFRYDQETLQSCTIVNSLRNYAEIFNFIMHWLPYLPNQSELRNFRYWMLDCWLLTQMIWLKSWYHSKFQMILATFGPLNPKLCSDKSESGGKWILISHWLISSIWWIFNQ